jgi:UDP-xylose/UDP-N-acetylglucosamine transporter B4
MNVIHFKTIFKVLLFCSINFYILELMIYIDPKCGGLITILQFLYFTFEGLLKNIKFDYNEKRLYFVERKKPLFFQCIIVFFYFLSTLLSNLSTSYNISLPVISVFRSSLK